MWGTKRKRKLQYLEHKKAAETLVNERLLHFNQFYTFTYNKVTVRDQKSRWGSCSSKKNINFNYRLALIPPHLADYVIVHELCHIGQMNHSQKFWDLVAKTIPDYAKRRRELQAIRIR